MWNERLQAIISLLSEVYFHDASKVVKVKGGTPRGQLMGVGEVRFPPHLENLQKGVNHWQMILFTEPRQ